MKYVTDYLIEIFLIVATSVKIFQEPKHVQGLCLTIMFFFVVECVSTQTFEIFNNTENKHV